MKWTWLFLCLSVVSIHAQTDSSPLVILPGEKTPQRYIGLDEVVVYQPIKLNSTEEMKKYILLRRRVLKVYPYAQLASNRFTTLKERLDNIERRRQKKRYTKRIEKFLEGEFSEELKKLTPKEGQILVKYLFRKGNEPGFGRVISCTVQIRGVFGCTARSFEKSRESDK